MITLTITLILILLLFIAWFKEARIFLFLFHKLTFTTRKGPALHINKLREFPGSLALEKNWEMIRQELNNVVAKNNSVPKFHEVDKANHRISFDNAPAWRTIVLKAYDGWFTDNGKKFPQTIKLLQEIPAVSTAMFSILEPHVKIPPHTGKFSGIWRYHMALSVPVTGHCYIEVNGERYYWKEGEGLLFNDTYLHAVTNDTDEYRVVLFLDIKKRASFFVGYMNDFILYLVRRSPVFKKAIKTGRISTG